MDTKVEIEMLATQLRNIIQYEVGNKTLDDFENKYNNLVYELERLISDAELLHEDYKEQKLTFNTIESEGFLRAMKTVRAVLERLEDN